MIAAATKTNGRSAIHRNDLHCVPVQVRQHSRFEVEARCLEDATLDRRTRRRAAVAFLEEDVFKTRDRTGVLIFLSLFERRVVVMGDEGINRAVETADWQAIVDRLVGGIHEGRPGDALVEAIGECGKLLESKEVAIRPDDTDELSDELRRHDS